MSLILRIYNEVVIGEGESKWPEFIYYLIELSGPLLFFLILAAGVIKYKKQQKE
jgi:hypothetical protein